MAPFDLFFCGCGSDGLAHCTVQSDPTDGTVWSFPFCWYGRCKWLAPVYTSLQLMYWRKERLSLLQFKAEVAWCLCQKNKIGVLTGGRPNSLPLEAEIVLKKKRSVCLSPASLSVTCWHEEILTDRGLDPRRKTENGFLIAVTVLNQLLK
jgi:hypothetical protein